MKKYFLALALSLISFASISATHFISNENVAILLDGDNAKGKVKIFPVDCVLVKSEEEKGSLFRYYQCKTGTILGVVTNIKTQDGGIIILSPDWKTELVSAEIKGSDIQKIK